MYRTLTVAIRKPPRPGQLSHHPSCPGENPRPKPGDSQVVLRPASVAEKHAVSIFAKLRMPPSEADNRRVLADLASRPWRVVRHARIGWSGSG
jgi:hypothetical protein